MILSYTRRLCRQNYVDFEDCLLIRSIFICIFTLYTVCSAQIIAKLKPETALYFLLTIILIPVFLELSYWLYKPKIDKTNGINWDGIKIHNEYDAKEFASDLKLYSLADSIDYFLISVNIVTGIFYHPLCFLILLVPALSFYLSVKLASGKEIFTTIRKLGRLIIHSNQIKYIRMYKSEEGEE